LLLLLQLLLQFFPFFRGQAFAPIVEGLLQHLDRQVHIAARGRALLLLFLPFRGRLGAAPAERVTLLRRAFDATMQDPDFKTDVEKMRVSLAPMKGGDLQKLVSQVSDLPADVTEMVRKVYQQ
jgi:hypothetical protein